MRKGFVVVLHKLFSLNSRIGITKLPPLIVAQKELCTTTLFLCVRKLDSVKSRNSFFCCPFLPMSRHHLIFGIFFCQQAQDYSRQLEEKLRARETEIQKLRETTSKTFTMATGCGSDTRNNSVISSRRQSRNSQSAQYANMELEDLKYELDEKEREINVSIIMK